MDENNKIKHLEMIENVIERMAKNCFQLKKWTMALVTIVGSLGAKESDKRFIVLTFAPIIGFCMLDAFYLQQERLFRALYRSVSEKNPEEIDFNMNTSKVMLTGEESKKTGYRNCLKSMSVSLFYGIIAITMVILTAILKGWIAW